MAFFPVGFLVAPAMDVDHDLVLPLSKSVTFARDVEIIEDDGRLLFVSEALEEVIASLRVPASELDIDDANSIADLLHGKLVVALEIPCSGPQLFLQQVRGIVRGRLGLEP